MTQNIGFIGLGNVGSKLANNLLNNGFSLTVRDPDPAAVAPFVERGADLAATPAELAASCDVVITCLPSPAICAAVMESDDGVIAGLTPGTIWMEMSTTDANEVARIAELVSAAGGKPLESPVSGGCHRAATGNISILVGGDRETFEAALPLLTVLGRRVLHTGEIGTASKLKVMTNYLATANLVTLCEALVTCAANGLDLATTYEAIRISSGNSFVHETESQVILNGSRDISFTMDLVLKDISLFQAMADAAGVDLTISPQLIEIFEAGIDRYGERELSPNIIRLLEDQTGLTIQAEGFPAEMIDDEPPAVGAEVQARR